MGDGSRSVFSRGGVVALFGLLACFVAAPVLAQDVVGEAQYRSIGDLDSRMIMWVVAELHLMFGAFVLGVPIFAIIVEIIGIQTGDKRYDDMAHEFTKLLSAAFATTAALGGLLGFLLFGLYPQFMGHLTGVFHGSMYVYALLFFGETFSLYIYYYSWDRLADRKWVHVAVGGALNFFGLAIVLVANSWASYMMSPVGLDPDTLAFNGDTWGALINPLWLPLNVHRLLANIVFGGFVVAAYSAVRFLVTAKNDEERAHYDWMGYVGNFVGILALIPLPFAGYYLGREVYSVSPVMGNNMMGGAFSWTFILQALLIAMIFLAANYYFWTSMDRIQGSNRYAGSIKWMLFLLLAAFAVWMTPHNLPLSAAEQIRIGGQYHPVLKYLGLMPAKNAVVNLIILVTFANFLIYRRANQGETVPVSQQGQSPKLLIPIVSAMVLAYPLYYGFYLLGLDPAELDLPAEKASLFRVPAYLLFIEVMVAVLACVAALYDRGRLAQMVLLGLTGILVTGVLGVYGFEILEKANPFLRNIAVVQVLLMICGILVALVIDIFEFRNAETLGDIRWGDAPARSQYALILQCLAIVMLMGLMGFIRSGLREDWHIYGVLRDTSAQSWTPTNATMTITVGFITLVFVSWIGVLFWIAGLSDKKEQSAQGGEGA
ncbi:MAG: cytochrome ubiquinol oxidase subunit I [Myxococcota bacterium]|jgi:cytochrome bd-type quinol oxidase subunit 1|nr:cytochrome ubiquinol oxidase subunit I [Myxococcota bacterium]